MNIRKMIRYILGRLGYEIRRMGCGNFTPDLSAIDCLKEKDLSYLSDPLFLESELLPKIGLNNEMLNEMPKELYPFCGRGLFSWQYPSQFSKYLASLTKFKIETYLEIGVRRGGTFIITVGYLTRFHPLKYSIGVDIESSPLMIEYGKINRRVGYMLVNSQSPSFKELIRDHSGFDLVFIDGDHSEAACQNDFDTVRDKANICVFHDIASDAAPGPRIVWNRIKAAHSGEYKFYEYVDQYESVKKRTGKEYLGIGVAVKNEFIKNSAPASK